MSDLQDNQLASLKNITDRARTLINMDANGSLNKIAKTMAQEGKLSYSEGGQTLQSTVSSRTNDNAAIMQSIPPKLKQKSKLPSAILESFSKTPINVNSVNDPLSNGNSVLDALDQLATQNSQKESIIKEQSIPTTTNGPIDYSIVKMIVEDCMKKYANSIKKSIINESKNNADSNNTLQAMKIGNKFSFITNTGDLYEAKLKFIKNINE